MSSYSYLSPALQQILTQNRKSMNSTKSMIKRIHTDAPILSTIVDYGGDTSVSDLLEIQIGQKYQHSNKFQRILNQSAEYSNLNEKNNKRELSFIDYKAEPARARNNNARKNKSKRDSQGELRHSNIVEMPQQLKQMKNSILNLPSINQSRCNSKNNIQNGFSRFQNSLKKSQTKRYQTEAGESFSKNRNQNKTLKYIHNLNDILSQFDCPEIQCNAYILDRHKQCKQIISHEKVLHEDYLKFQSLGNPPQKIINLKNRLQTFQKAINNNLDSELAHQISTLDQKRFDIVLKHEQQIRKLNLVKFQEKKKRDRIQQGKNALVNVQRSDQLNFKLNSQGKQVFTNRSKNHKNKNQ